MALIAQSCFGGRHSGFGSPDNRFAVTFKKHQGWYRTSEMPDDNSSEKAEARSPKPGFSPRQPLPCCGIQVEQNCSVLPPASLSGEGSGEVAAVHFAATCFSIWRERLPPPGRAK
jgi:hypothetical protein